MVKAWCKIDEHQFNEPCADDCGGTQCSECGAVKCHDCGEITVWVEGRPDITPGSDWFHQRVEADECFLSRTLPQGVGV